MTRCFIALGSNLGNRLSHLRGALSQLRTLPGTAIAAASPLYENPAVGPGTQPDYLNAVVELYSDLPSQVLLTALQRIEATQGRVREQRWGARTLDLDLLLFGDETLHTPTLHVPHPRMLQRNFVLYALYDLAPDLLLPDGTTLRSDLDSCSSAGLIRSALTLQE